jgi:hypothetical protein
MVSTGRQPSSGRAAPYGGIHHDQHNPRRRFSRPGFGVNIHGSQVAEIHRQRVRLTPLLGRGDRRTINRGRS